MNYIVFDLEWNQPIDSNPDNKRALAFEIIEIGAVKLNEKFEIIDSFSELIRPVVYRKLNWHTKNMLKINIKDLNNCRRFKDVAKDFLSFCGEDAVFGTWGTQDLSEFQRNMAYYGMKPLSDGPIMFYDIQKMYGQYTGEQRAYNLESAVDLIGIEKDTPFHRAYADAYYTGKIMSYLMDKDSQLIAFGRSYDLYHLPKSDKHVVKDFNGITSYLVTPLFDDRVEMKNNRRYSSMTCAKCGNRVLRPKIRWFSNNSKNYHGAAICAIHGPIKGLLRIRHTDKGRYYMEKFMTYTDLEELDKIKKKKTEMGRKPKQEVNKTEG